MRSAENDRALYVAERLLDYSYEKERRKREREQRYRQRKQELKRTRKNIAVLTIVAAVLLCLCIMMIKLDIQVRGREERVSDLKAEVSELKKRNKEAEKRLANTVDYQWVREEARKLGMARATEDRVYYYTVEAGDYMVQYDSIPQ